MGASRERKKRLEVNETGRAKANEKAAEEAKKNKRFKATAITVLVIVLVCAAVIFMLRSNFFYQNATAVKVNDTKYSVAEFNYYREVKIKEYRGYFGDLSSMEGFITSDTIKDATIDDLEKMTMYLELAEEDGFELPANIEVEIQDSITALDGYATMMGQTLDQYIESTYGKGVTAEVFEESARKYALAKAYEEYRYDCFEYDPADLEAAYAAEDNDVFGYYLYTFYNSGYSEEADPAAATKKLADEFASKVTDIESFQQLAVEYATGYNKTLYERDEEAAFIHNAGDAINATYFEWVIDESRKEGDLAVFTDDVASYVVYYVNRNTNEYNPVSVREIIFEVDVAYSEYDNDEDYKAAYEEDRQANIKSAESVLQQWKEGEMTEESFARLADTYNQGNITDDGGMLELVVQDVYDKAINDWCYDPARQPGDAEVVVTPSGAYVIYFVGEYGQSYRHYTVDRDLRADNFKSWEEEAVAAYEGKAGAFVGFADKNM